MSKKKKKQSKNLQPKSQNQSKKNNGELQLADWEQAIRGAKSQIKHIDKQVLKSVPKGIQHDFLNSTSFNNAVFPKDKIPDRYLRLVEKKNGIVGSIITLRIQQALEFALVSNDKDIPGWEVVLKDSKKTPTAQQKKQKEFLEDLILNNKINNYTGLEKHDSDFKDMIIQYTRDRLLIDKVCWEVERNQKGEAVALWIIDGATIVPVLPGGFYGSSAQFGVGNGFNKLSDEIHKAKLEAMPPIEDISYIQELFYGSSGGGIIAGFSDEDLIFDLGNPLNDVRLYKQGLSVVEKANIAVIAFINSLTFNSNGLSRGAIPKIALSLGKDAQFTEAQLEDMQDEWMANFESMDGQWNIPLLNSDAKVLNLMPNNRDMEYQKYLEFSGALTCSIMGVDSAEIGLRLAQAQNVMSENSDSKQIFSKNRGLRELLNGFSYIMNKFLKMSGYDFANDFTFKFNGLSTEDKGFEADLRKKKVEATHTVDEVRAELDLPPLPDGLGEIILNSVFMQNKQAQEMAQQGDDGGFEDDDEPEGFGDYSDDNDDDNDDDSNDSIVDEVMDDLEKAVKLI